VAMAEGGTLFLDEIGELPLSLQVKLLRLLQERTYEPVGSAHSVSANFRLIAATNRDLAAEVEAGRFRSDLYYRLLVCPLQLPPLRERRGDIPSLFLHFWERAGDTRPVDEAVLQHLTSLPWKGNIRELENFAERLSVCAEGSSVRMEDLTDVLPDVPPACPSPVAFPPASAPPAHLSIVPSPACLPPASEAADGNLTLPTLPPLPSTCSAPVDLPALLRELEERYIRAALAATRGNKKAAASMLGLQRTTLVEKLRRRTPAPLAAS